MLFNSIAFICAFFPISLLGYFALGRLRRKEPAILWLIICSLVFYGWWNVRYVPLLIGTMIFNYYLGTKLSRGTKHAKAVLVFGVAADLALLAYFKYTNFFLENVNILTGANIALPQIILPLGISFYTFQQIAYRVEAFNGKRKNDTFLNYCACVTFFPHLIAGPIVRYSSLMPQFENPKSFTPNAKNMAIGLTVFVMGLAKKVLIADVCGQKANPIFASVTAGYVPSTPEAWIAILAFTLQVYFDFSGYSDMALGIARTFNIELPVNFDSPYKSRSIAEFWTRSHITLSHFIRDHLYQPLARAKKRPGRLWLYTCVFISMTIMGLWHGAGWTFVVYGLVHASAQVINFVYRNKMFALTAKPMTPLVRFLREEFHWLCTIGVVVGALVLFRSENFPAAMRMYRAMIGFGGPEVYVNPLTVIKLVTIAVVTKWGPNVYDILGDCLFSFGRERPSVILPSLLRWQPSAAIAVGMVLVSYVVLYKFFDGPASEFVYFQF
ncbi:MAG: MBOAT family protein [Deltaproteobacteria bacterium]|nr:MBOAT family protein [Deltaproteobacteria bacterium]MBI3295793.1 MBOAT family protein [Deltaproteobacteria bacterium]